MSDTPKVNHCPVCGHGEVAEKDTEGFTGAFAVVGKYDGNSYERELSLDAYSCTKCNAEWWM